MALAALVAATGLSVSVGAGTALANGQRAAAGQQMDRHAGLVAEAVANETGRYVDTLRAVAGAIGAYEPLNARKFAQAAQPLAQMRLAGATSIAFLVPAADAQIAATQALWRGRGLPDLVLRTRGSGREHIFSIFSRSLDSTAASSSGIDASQAAAPTGAMTEARRSGRETVSDAYQLILDQNLPAAKRQMSFVLTAAVYGPPDASGRRAFRGWVLMGLRGQDFIGVTLAHISQGLLDVTLRARNADGTEVPVAGLHAAVSGRRDLSRDIAVTVADRQWHLQIQATGQRLPGAATGLPALVDVAGSVLGLLLAGLVYVLASGRARARSQVRAATAELRAAEAQARRQADLLTAIMNSISDGVGVVDEHGAFLLHNPAAKAMLGLDTDEDGADSWQDHYGMFRPDGVTPFPTQEMPLVRALAGESTEQVEMIIRNPGRPGGITITVSGRPLADQAGRVGAVAVFHDITARKQVEAQMAAVNEELVQTLTGRETAQIELQAVTDTLADQQTYLTEMMDSIAVAVTTCDTTGTMVRRNHAARAMTAHPSEAGDLAGVARALRLTDPDGRPVPADQLPMTRALTGTSVAGQPMTVHRGGDRPRHLLVDAHPLHDVAGAIIGAVACAVDVSILREREAELRAFADVVAHDLKAPLATIVGFGELAAGELAAGDLDQEHPDVETALNGLGRIICAAARMGTLIDNLLTYAKARDAVLRGAPTDLHTLIDDVIAARTDQPLAAGAPPPQTYVGPLPTVHADPVLLRHPVPVHPAHHDPSHAPAAPAPGTQPRPRPRRGRPALTGACGVAIRSARCAVR